MSKAENIRDRAAKAYGEGRLGDITQRVADLFAEACDENDLDIQQALALAAAVSVCMATTVYDTAQDENDPDIKNNLEAYHAAFLTLLATGMRNARTALEHFPNLI
jgi:hypothetical protein